MPLSDCVVAVIRTLYPPSQGEEALHPRIILWISDHLWNTSALWSFRSPSGTSRELSDSHDICYSQQLLLCDSKTTPFFVISYPKLCFRVVLNHFQRLRVLPFDPQWNFTSILISGFFSNFFKKIFFRSIKKSWKSWKIENFQNLKNRNFRSNFFLKKLEQNPDINIEVKFHGGSNGSTLSLWKWFQNHSKA